MGTEIERKFLVRSDRWRSSADAGRRFRQGYLPNDGASCAVRVRTAGDKAWLTVKGYGDGVSRPEFEYPIPLGDAEQMLDTLCRRPLIEKTRHLVRHAGRTWEVDVFEGQNAGLVVAEIELTRADEPFELPPWAGRDVTLDPRYLNVNLVENPYSAWRSDEAPA